VLVTLAYSSGARHRERGQTIPFWVFSTLTVLALLFFIINYANTVRWQVRAQNAADSSAIAKISGDAAMLNNVTLLLYALNLQEIKSQAILGSTYNLLGGNTPCGAVGIACIGSYVSVVNNTVQNIGSLTTIANQLTNAITSLSNLSTNPTSAINQIAGQGCVNLQTDCSFTYTTQITPFPAGAPPLTVAIDEIACRKVQPIGAGLLQLTGPFYAIGHASIELSPLASTLTPGATNASSTGLPDLPVQNLIPGISSPGLQLNPAPLTASLGILIPAPVPASQVPAANLAAIESTCAG
jgi:hypothetical protein